MFSKVDDSVSSWDLGFGFGARIKAFESEVGDLGRVMEESKIHGGMKWKGRGGSANVLRDERNRMG